MQQFLNMLCCPETHQPLELATAELLNEVNGRIKAGQVKNRAGKLITEPIEGGLIRQDKKFLYPIRGAIPAMLIEEALPLQT